MGELKTYGQPNVVIALAANKCDLEDYRVVSSQEGKAYAQEQEMAYFETSAKTAHNVRQMFVELGEHLESDMNQSIQVLTRDLSVRSPARTSQGCAPHSQHRSRGVSAEGGLLLIYGCRTRCGLVPAEALASCRALALILDPVCCGC